jgi:SAM-dependent methyltransferase
MLATGLLGPRGMWRHVLRRLGGAPSPSVRICLDELRGKRGLELGGPSDMFRARGCVPMYEVVADLDGCNFSSETLWQGRIAAGRTFVFRADRPAGQSFVADAVSLQPIETGQYDFVASSHVLEHVANPMRSLEEQLRVTNDRGALLVVLPHGAASFDWRRSVTPFAHILEDYEKNVAEDDASHVEEFLQLIDLDVAAFPGGHDELAKHARNNLEHRVIHQHVFDEPLVAQMLNHLRLEVVSLDVLWPFHIVALARKTTVTSVAR